MAADGPPTHSGEGLKAASTEVKTKVEATQQAPPQNAPENEPRRFSKKLAFAMLRRAKKVREMGVYLDVMDLSILAKNRKVDVTFLRDTVETDLETASLQDYVQSFVPEDLGLETSEGHWAFVLTNASYNPSNVLNHWVPAILESMVSEEYFKSLLVLGEAAAQARVNELEGELLELRQGVSWIVKNNV